MAKAKSQVEKRREYVAEHPEEIEALNDRPPVPVLVNPVVAVQGALQALAPVAAVERRKHSGSSARQGEDDAPRFATVADAEAEIADIDDAEDLRNIIATDSRKGVKDAAQKRLDQLEDEA
jgi:hypothetical protein